jgi:hypothetical protein
MRTIGVWSLLLIFFITGRCQAGDFSGSIAVFGTYHSSSELFHHVNDPDASLRDQYLPLDNILCAGIDYRRRVESLRLELIASVEYIGARTGISIPVANTPISGSDGYAVIPIELSAVFDVPMGTDAFRMYVGGGGGVYFGWRRYETDGVTASIDSRSPGAGIQILTGIEVPFWRQFAFRTEVKFRDVRFESTSHFPAAYGTSGLLPLATDPVTSRVSIDGTTLHFGIAWRL